MVKNLDFIMYPLPEDIERLVGCGDLDRAVKVIEKRLASPLLPEALKQRLRFELRRIKVLPRTYTLTEEEMLYKLQSTYRDFSREEMETLRDEGTLDWAFIDGKILYKTNALNNTIKTRVDWHDRLLNDHNLDEIKENAALLDGIIAKMKKNGHARARFRLRTTVTVDKAAQCPGKKIRVHLPLPLDTAQSKTIGQVITSPSATHIAATDEAQRTAYFEEIYQPDMSFTAEYSYEIDAPYVNPDPDKVSSEQPSFDTEELLPHIRFTPFIRALCAELKGDETNPLRIARKFYDYCTVNCCYRFVPAYFTKLNIPEFFAAGQRGDCGMHALLFITLCRCAGIPAQWQAGLCCRPGDVGNHDWARFYIAPYGWLYADASYGGSAYRAGALDRWNFYFGNLDPWRMVANRDFQQEFDPPKVFLRADPYDSQDGEVEYEDRGLYGFEFDTERELIDYELYDD